MARGNDGFTLHRPLERPLILYDSAVNLLSFELKTWSKLIEDGAGLVVSWASRPGCATQKEDFLTLSCGPTLGDDDYLQRKNATETDATPYSVRFSGVRC
ncbi:Calcineurin-like phosphoesterase [Globisporangium polare]